MKALESMMAEMLLRGNTAEKKTSEEDALMFKLKNFLRWFLLAALLFFPFMFYVPMVFEDGVSRKEEDGILYGWGLNTSRSVPLYVIPDNETTLISSSKICSEPLILLVMVASSLNHFKERSVIRQTWGNYSSSDYQVAFMLGTTNNSTVQEEIEEESRIFDDIIQENFIDSYNNLTLKSIAMLKYVKNHCDQAEFIVKADDDTFIYLPNLLSLIKVIKEKKLKDVLLGQRIANAKPILEITNKWYSPRYMYKEKKYPLYLSGTCYLMKRQTALKLYKAALKLPYFHLEDVFITGMCAARARVMPKPHSGFTYLQRPLDPCLYLKNQNVISSHRLSLDNFRQLWKSLNNGTKCSGGTGIKLARLEHLDWDVKKKSKL